MLIIKVGSIGSGGGIKHARIVIDYFKNQYDNDVYILGNNFIRETNSKKYSVIKILLLAFFNRWPILVLDCKWFLPFFKTTVVPQNMLLFDKEVLSQYSVNKKLKYFFLKYSQLTSMFLAYNIMNISQYANDTISKYFLLRNKQMFINPMGMDSQQIKRRNLSKNEINIVYVSNFIPYKNHKKLISDIEYAIKRNKIKTRIKLHLVGEGFNDEMIKNVEAYSWIKLYGKLQFNDIIKLYEKCDLSIFYSLCENSPNVLFELITNKIPVVTLDIRPMNEIISNKKYLISKSNSAEELEKILSIVKNESWQNEFELYLQNINGYSWADHCEKIDSHLYRA